MAFDPVRRRPDTESLQIVLVCCCTLVQVDPSPEHSADAEDLRAVRVLGGLAARMMFAMHRDPLPRDHAGGQPAPEAEKVCDHGMELHAAMRLAAVQIER